ncbi:MAG: TIGR04282 family arsenosugar biosynthesis glycosyltransferase [Eudoraea sp.]|nr:TIGR04282 family arsenosugar biosynthesis glycosyltransferase [Eudoraea sp.]
MTDSKELLLIFTRNPELGKCKTRLAATIGERAALEVYKFLLKHTVSITANLKTDKTVYYSENIRENDIWPKEVFNKQLQQGEDLGTRMLNAFRNGFDAGYDRIIIIGSDIYDLSEADLKLAFKLLREKDYVLGPALDGGYYLLGMKRLNPTLFQNKDWGSATVLSSTIIDLEGEEYHLLETRNDVDVYDDIKDNKIFLPYLKHIDNDQKTT